MNPHSPESHDDYIEGEVVEGDIWNSCTRHHARHCVACFPHQPWQLMTEEEIAYEQDLVRDQLFAPLLENMAKATEALEQMSTQAELRLLKKLRRFTWFWCAITVVYVLCAVVEIMALDYVLACVYLAMAGFSIRMTVWNRRKIKDLTRG